MWGNPFPAAHFQRKYALPFPHTEIQELIKICVYCYLGLGAVKCEKTYELCEGCGQKIHDRYLMRVGDASWHEQCLSCCVCGVPLDHSCYVRNSKLYCKTDYDR